MALAVLHTPGEWFKRYTAAGTSMHAPVTAEQFRGTPSSP